MKMINGNLKATLLAIVNYIDSYANDLTPESKLVLYSLMIKTFKERQSELLAKKWYHFKWLFGK